MKSVRWVLPLALAAAMPVAAQQATLTPQDYLDIQQLVSKYAYAIDECTNKGYDYADLYVADGAFLTSRNGQILNRFEGRERLAAAARGGMPDCKDVPCGLGSIDLDGPAPEARRKGRRARWNTQPASLYFLTQKARQSRYGSAKTYTAPPSGTSGY